MRHAHQSLETSDPILARLGIGYHPTLALFICLHPSCLRAITGLSYHIRLTHKDVYEGLSKKERQLIPKDPPTPGPDFLPDYHHSRPPPELPYLTTVPGFVCKSCHFAAPNLEEQTAAHRAKTASLHLLAQHPDANPGQWQRYFSPVAHQLQTFYHPKRRGAHRYFPVGPPLPLGWSEAPCFDGNADQDQNFAAFNEFLDTPVPYDAEDDLHNIHPILRQYRLHHYLNDYDRALIHEVVNTNITADEPVAFRILGPILKETFRHVFLLSRDTEASPGVNRTNMQWLWSFAPNGSVFADGPPDSAFLENISCTTLLENYVPTILRLVLVALRYWNLSLDHSAEGFAARRLLPRFPLTRQTAINLALLNTLLCERLCVPTVQQAEVDVRSMELVINVLRSLLQDATDDDDDGNNPNPPLVFRFMAMVASRRDGGFRPCSLLTPPTQHLITASRAVVLWLAVHRPPPVDPHVGVFRHLPSPPSPQHALHLSILHHRHHIVVDGRSSPFVFLHSFFNITRALAMGEAAFTPHVWTDGSQQSRFTADGVPFDTALMARNLRALRNDVRHLYKTVVLRGYPFNPIALDDVVDDPRTLKPGYSFATDPVNNFRVLTQQAHRYLETESDRGHKAREFRFC